MIPNGLPSKTQLRAAKPRRFFLLAPPNLSHDKYTLTLSPTPHSTPPVYIPVLSHTLRPDPLIKLLLTHLAPSSPPFPYGALILTSQRSAAALNAALASPAIQSKLAAAGNKSSLHELFAAARLIIYTVGPATFTAVRDVCANHDITSTVEVRGGEDAGSGEILARGILDVTSPLEYGIFADEEGDVAAAPDALPNHSKHRRKKPILFLAGETRRDIIPRLLQSADLPPEERIQVDEMTVYASTELEAFAFEYKGALARTTTTMEMLVAGGPGQGIRWTVVFSPMAGRGMLEGLGWLDGEGGTRKVDPQKMEGRRDYICCIGPTTRAYLSREFGVEADVMAEKPSPEGVREGIEKFMAELGRPWK
ncbi:MAG: uroporphyrinogen-III synthase [Ramalina farinacea]|uniref:Uroporphyrinogen-III synthase n=1 Tax=Ramalina farinacea TaxID=258253 RepID=A0AA43QGY5_9LECA|nr:uroporphyrinogen-III synthase [Ramalina farinacea]